MGILVNFCAGVSEDVLPSNRVEAILANVPQNAASEKAISDTRSMLESARVRFFMLDSGGFQLLDRELKGGTIDCDPSRPLVYNPNEINLAPCHVAASGQKLRPDILTSLDLPVLKIEGQKQQQVEFMKKLGFNLVWMTETARLRRQLCPDTELFIPVQCYDLDQFGYLERHLSSLEYDGLSLPTRNLDPAGIALFLLKFYKMGIRKVHLLSVSNFSGIALAAYFARHLFDWFSIDATTWRKVSEYQDYLHPMDLKRISVSSNEVFDERRPLPCICPWCSRTTFTQIKHLPYTDKTEFLRCHNYFVIESLGRDLYARSAHFNSYIQHLRERNQRQARKVGKLIEALTIVHHRRDEPIEILSKVLGGGKL
jgi:queuine/archaeosine tRNA-ribosyltransferase